MISDCPLPSRIDLSLCGFGVHSIKVIFHSYNPPHHIITFFCGEQPLLLEQSNGYLCLAKNCSVALSSTGARTWGLWTPMDRTEVHGLGWHYIDIFISLTSNGNRALSRQRVTVVLGVICDSVAKRNYRYFNIT